MSKSLGNSPDVLDLMTRFGADGVRFGLLRIAPQGQDIRFDEKQVEEGRNFANKIWNAARFYQMQEPALPFGTRVSYRPAPYVLDIESQVARHADRRGGGVQGIPLQRGGATALRFLSGATTATGSWKPPSRTSSAWTACLPAERVTERGIAKHVALFTMYRVLTEFLALLHPFMPHLTEELDRAPELPAASCRGHGRRHGRRLARQRLVHAGRHGKAKRRPRSSPRNVWAGL